MRHNLLVGTLVVALLITLLGLVTIAGLCLSLPLGDANNSLALLLPSLAVLLLLAVIAAISVITIVWGAGMLSTFSYYRRVQLAEARVQASESLIQVEQWRDRLWDVRMQKILAGETLPASRPSLLTSTAAQVHTTPTNQRRGRSPASLTLIRNGTTSD